MAIGDKLVHSELFWDAERDGGVDNGRRERCINLRTGEHILGAANTTVEFMLVDHTVREEVEVCRRHHVLCCIDMHEILCLNDMYGVFHHVI